MPTKRKTARPSKADPDHSIAADVDAVVAALKRLGNKRTRDEMSTRYGIHLPDPEKAFGVGMAAMQKVARGVKGKDPARNHRLAAALWETGWYEARTVAAFVDEPELVTPGQMDRWCRDFDNWGICDTVCFKLFDQTPHAFAKVKQWSDGGARHEFVHRAAFALLACLALHNKVADDEPFMRCLPLIERAATDDRNFVKKGLLWALRAIAKRNRRLQSAVVIVAQRLVDSSDPASQWVGKSILRELRH